VCGAYSDHTTCPIARDSCHRFGVSSLDSEMWTHSFCLILRLVVAVL
jgi:hypothetical protein